MAGGLEGHYPGAEEKSRGRHRPATDGRSVATADRTGQCSRTQPGHDWGLKHFRSAPKVFGALLKTLTPPPLPEQQSKNLNHSHHHIPYVHLFLIHNNTTQ